MGTGLDGSYALKNASETESVPLSGWRCHVGDVKFIDDPHLRISHDQPPACGEITISATGGAAKWPSCLGVYTPTKTFSAGRQVFKHQTQERYLLVPPDKVSWLVQPSVESKVAWMASSCAPSMCPEDPRARTSERLGLTSWRYADNSWKDGDITVKCSVHFSQNLHYQTQYGYSFTTSFLSNMFYFCNPMN